jgi:hypothetical protein
MPFTAQKQTVATQKYTDLLWNIGRRPVEAVCLLAMAGSRSDTLARDFSPGPA